MSNLFSAAELASSQAHYVGNVAASGQRNLPPGGEAGLEHILATIRHADRQIIDLGCNTGHVARTIAQAHPQANVCGLDIDRRMIEVARKVETSCFCQLEFVETNGRTINEACGAADLIVCAGSSAFFSEPGDMFRQVHDSLLPRGRFVDSLYLYAADTPPELRARERQAFGLGWTPASLEEALAMYAGAGLLPVSLTAIQSFVPDMSEQAALIREILREIPAVRSVVEEIESRLDLIDQLSKHRIAVFIELVRTEDFPGFEDQPEVRDWSDIAALQAHFCAGQEPIALQDLNAMLPHQVLAYFGDTDAAPGGGKSVTDLAKRLVELGLDHSASIVDVGCFTGLSTVALAQYFPNVIGVDIDPKSLAIAQRCAAPIAPTARFQLSDARRFDCPDNTFDAVILTATLGYTDDPVAMLAECFRVLRPGGLFAEFVYHHDRTDETLRQTVGENLQFLTLGQSLNRFINAGFVPVVVERIHIPNCPIADVSDYYDFVSELEAARDPVKKHDELTEAIALYRRYSIEHSENRSDIQICYRCVFTKKIIMS